MKTQQREKKEKRAQAVFPVLHKTHLSQILIVVESTLTLYLRRLLLALIPDGGSGSTSGLGVLTSDLKVPPVSQTSVHSDLLHSLDVFSELGIEVVGGDLLVFPILDVFPSVEEPLWEPVALWLGNDLGDLVNFVVRKLACSLGRVYPCLLAKSDGESSADSLYGSDCVWHESLSVNVRVEYTDNVLKVVYFLQIQALALSQKIVYHILQP